MQYQNDLLYSKSQTNFFWSVFWNISKNRVNCKTTLVLHPFILGTQSSLLDHSTLPTLCSSVRAGALLVTAVPLNWGARCLPWKRSAMLIVSLLIKITLLEVSRVHSWISSSAHWWHTLTWLRSLSQKETRSLARCPNYTVVSSLR